MKNEKNTELIKQHLKDRKKFKVFINDKDFGVFYYDSKKEIYQGEFGFLTLESMINAIKHIDEDCFIKLEIVDE